MLLHKLTIPVYVYDTDAVSKGPHLCTCIIHVLLLYCIVISCYGSNTLFIVCPHVPIQLSSFWTIQIYLLYRFDMVVDLICYLNMCSRVFHGFKIITIPSINPSARPDPHTNPATIHLKNLWAFPASWAKEEFPCHQAFGCFFGTSASHPLLCQQPQCQQQLFPSAYEGGRREGRWRDMAAEMLRPNRPRSRKSFTNCLSHCPCVEAAIDMQDADGTSKDVSSCSAKSSVSTAVLQGMVQDHRHAHTHTHIQGGWRDAWHPESGARHRVACLQ